MNRHRHNHRPTAAGFDFTAAMAIVRPEVSRRLAAARIAQVLEERRTSFVAVNPQFNSATLSFI